MTRSSHSASSLSDPVVSPGAPRLDRVAGDFFDDTAVTLQSPGVFGVTISDRWSVGVGANGGYVAGLLTRALLHDLSDEQRQLRSLTTHFLRPALPGPATITVRVLRAGNTTTADATLIANGKEIAIARGVIAGPRATSGWIHRAAPPFPDPESVPLRGPMDDKTVPARYDIRFVTGGMPPPELSTAEASGWIRPADGAVVDVTHLVAITDAFPPPIVMMAGPPLVASTIDLTVHVFPAGHHPTDDWLAVTNRSSVLADGYIECDTELWSREGQLLAQARQLGIAIAYDPN